jgi:hypothetical protein
MGNNDEWPAFGPTGREDRQEREITPPEEGSTVVQTNPDVASQADRYVCVWDEEPFDVGGVSGLLVILPTMKDAGKALEETYSFQISTNSSGLKYPRVAMAPDGRFVVTYFDTSRDSVRVMAQRFDAHALRIGPPYSVSSLGGGAATLQGGVAADSWRIRYAFADNRDHRSWDTGTNG